MSKIENWDDDTIRAVFGHEAAEDDDINRLKEFYFKNATYSRLRANHPLRLLIGHKGIGKSAMLAVAAQEDMSRHQLVVSLRPDDISDVDIDAVGINAQIRVWKEGLLRIIGGKIFESFSIGRLFNADQHVSTWMAIAKDFGKTISNLLSAHNVSIDESKKAVLNEFINNNEIRVYIDDLDRGWSATPASVTRMSALLNAVRDVSREFKNVHFVISLRSDVFYLVRTSDESTDKLESACIWFSWTNHEILAMLIKRIKTYFGRPCPTDEALIRMDQKDLAIDLGCIMATRFKGYGAWENIPTHRMLMTLIRRRPRDLVKLCTLAARHAYENGRMIIDADDFDAIFSRYSQDRLQDTVNEYKSELVNIQELLENMKPSQRQRRRSSGLNSPRKFIYTGADMLSKINSVCQGHRFRFYGKRTDADAKELLNFMYKIGFVTARKQTDAGKITRHFFEEQNYVSSRHADYGYSWEIHPAYRWALNPAENYMGTEIDFL